MADIASEPWTGFSPERWTAFRSESPAGFIGIRTLTESYGAGPVRAAKDALVKAQQNPIRR